MFFVDCLEANYEKFIVVIENHYNRLVDRHRMSICLKVCNTLREYW